MTLFSTLKLIHVLCATVFFGTGIGTAYFKYRADRSGDVAIIAWTAREVVRADWLFTVPSGAALPLTGSLLIHLGGGGWSWPWIWQAFAGYAVAGVCWLPAAWMQMRVRKLADEALANGTEMPAEFERWRRWWTILGVPSFTAAMVVIWLMIAKYNAWVF